MPEEIIKALYKSASIELANKNIPPDDLKDLRQELICQSLAFYIREKEKRRIPSLSTLRTYIHKRRKELHIRSFLGNRQGGGSSQLDIMNICHQWNGTYSKLEFLDELANSRKNTKEAIEENLSFLIDLKIFIRNLEDQSSRKIFSMLLKGYSKKDILDEVGSRYSKLILKLIEIKRDYI